MAVILLDQIDFLADDDSQSLEHFLHLWLPREFPSHIQCIVSCRSSSRHSFLATSLDFPVIRFGQKIFRLHQDKQLLLKIESNLEGSQSQIDYLNPSPMTSEADDLPNLAAQSFYRSQMQLFDLVTEFAFADYSAPRESKDLLVRDCDLAQKNFFSGFLFPKLLARPASLAPLREFECKGAWLMHQFRLFCPDQISFERLRDLLYFLKLSCCGLSVDDLARLSSIPFSKVDEVLEYLSPLLVRTVRGFRLSCGFLRGLDLEVDSTQSLNSSFVKLMTRHRNSVSRLFELANLLMNDSQYFSLKQTLSKVENFLLLFNSPTKYSLFK